MRHTMTFGIINQVANNIVELCIDENSVFTESNYQEYRTVIDKYFEKPYGVIVNQVHYANFDASVIAKIANNGAVIGIAAVNYSADNDKVACRFIKQLRTSQLPLKTFSGYQLGRMKAHQWLNLIIETQHQQA